LLQGGRVSTPFLSEAISLVPFSSNINRPPSATQYNRIALTKVKTFILPSIVLPSAAVDLRNRHWDFPAGRPCRINASAASKARRTGDPHGAAMKIEVFDQEARTAMRLAALYQGVS
jgi:hypothetical protein